MKYVLPLLILINIHEIIGVLEWTVTGKVTDFGQNVTLFCHVRNCCPRYAGWDRWTPKQRTLFIDVKTGRPNKKYDGKVMKDGYTLVIQNLTENDLNVSYSCLYGGTLGEQKFLLREDVFTRSPNSSSRFSVGEIAALIAGVVALVLVLIIIEVWRRRKKRKPNNSIKKQDSDTEMDKLITKPSVPVGPLSIGNITDSSAFIEWQAPQNDGGAEVEEYQIEYQLVDASSWIMCETVNGNTYNYCVKDLKEGRCYNFKVTARNGYGPGSSLDALLPTKLLAKPSAPVGPLSISNITDSSVFIEWKAPQNDGGAEIEEYQIEYQLVDETTWIMCETVNGIIYNYCVENLKEGQSYNFQVTARNRCGPGSSLESLKPTKLLEIPKDISRADRNTYMEALRSGTEVKKYVRIQVIGQDRVGKTSLVRRLLKCEHDGKSTDGIEIHRRYQMRTKGEGELFDCKVETQREKIALRIKEIVNSKNDPAMPSKTVKKHTIQNRSLSEDNSMQADNTEKKPNSAEDQINRTDTSDVNVVSKINNNEHVVARYTNDFPDHADASYNKPDESKLAGTGDLTEEQYENDNEEPDSSEDLNVLNSKNIDNIAEALNGIFKNVRIDMETENFVDCGIWDFAGQKDYYATHQTFFTPYAIYLLVVDITKDINPIQNDGTFKLDYSGDYIDFWFNSIHCFCQDTKAVKLCPPVIMVCTNADKFMDNLTAEEVLEKAKNYRDKFRDIFGGRRWSNHNRGIHIISNTHPVQSDIDSLKLQITEIAEEMDFFAETLPTRWIKLENALEVLKESIETVSFKDIEKLANMNSMKKKEELILFLNHQHKIGSIIFFEDIPEYIILRPYWLVKCFRCLVCDEDKKTYDITMSKEKYNLIHKGELSGKLIDELFKKEPSLQFRKKKKHILGVMEKFDILVTPKCKEVENTIYYMPCMLENSSSLEEIIKNNIKLKNPHRSPWLILAFKFLPIAYFNHILFNYIREYTLCKVKSGDIAGKEHPALFVGKAIVQLDTTKNRLLIICFSMNAISLQIWSWKDVLETTYKDVLLHLCTNIGDLESKLMHNLNYKIKAKCSTGDYARHSDRISQGDLSTKCEEGKYRCEEHCCDHNKDELETTWLKHVPYIQHKITERKKKQAENEEEVIPVNIRKVIIHQIEDWKKKDKKFVSTRASDKVMKCLKDNSCVTLTGPAGVGKSFIARHTSLVLQKDGYRITPVFLPSDIRDYYQPGKQTVFIVDDICGNYSANQKQIDNWKQLLAAINTVIADNCCKIIVCCRLQVYKDDKFNILSPFKSCECNLISDELLLTSEEKIQIANMYMGTSMTDIDDFSTECDFFPLLCSLYHGKEDVNVIEFFKIPFKFYESELDRLSKYGNDGKYKICSLALCVLFNNQLNEKWFQGKATAEQRHILVDTCEACDVREFNIIPKQKLKEALDTLDGTFVYKQNGIYKTIHDKLFDFLVHYFGQTMMECLIDHIDSDLLHERFIWQKSSDDMNNTIDFRIKITYDYLVSYLERFIKDLSAGKVTGVFRNPNMKEPSFRQHLLQYLLQLDKSQQVTLANTRDTAIPIENPESGSTPLIDSCYGGYTDMVEWILVNDVDVNQCRYDGDNGLHMSCQKGHTDIVKLLLERNPNVDIRNSNGWRPLDLARQNGFTDIVMLLS